jgi:hypothetical protein
MKFLDLVNAPFRAAGLEFKKREAWRTPEDLFHEWSYLESTARRLEHLASLGLPLHDKTVLEVGAGIGDLTGYFLNRGCHVTITEGRPGNLDYIRHRYPQCPVALLDLETPTEMPGAPFDIVACFGVLYHVSNPAEALHALAEQCQEMLLLATSVSFGSHVAENIVDENIRSPTQAVSGRGCRPTRPWIFEALARDFEHVYVTRTQPNHEQYPIDWSKPEAHTAPLSRAVFVASRAPIHSDQLLTELRDQQERMP